MEPFHYKAGIKCVANNNPMNSIDSTKGVKNPQTGQRLLVKV